MNELRAELYWNRHACTICRDPLGQDTPADTVACFEQGDAHTGTGQQASCSQSRCTSSDDQNVIVHICHAGIDLVGQLLSHIDCEWSCAPPLRSGSTV